MSGRPSPDRRLRVAAVGLGLWPVPSRGYRAVSTSPGGPAGLSPPRRPYRSRHLREFPVSPYSGRQPRSRSSGNTTGLQRFSQNKEEEGQVSLFLVPSSGSRGQGSGSRLQPMGRTPRDSAARLSPTNWLRTRRAICPGRLMPTGQLGASDPRAKASQARAALLTSRRSLCSAQPRASRGREDAPAGQELLTRGFTSRCSHPARGAPRASLAPWTPSPRPRPRPESPPRAPLTCGARGPALPAPLPSSPLPPPPVSPILPGSRFNPGGGVRVARVTPPSAGPGSPRAGGGDGPERQSRARLVRAGRQEEGFLPGKARDALSAGPRGSPGTLPSPAGLLGLGRSASPSPLPLDRAGGRRFAPEHSSLDSGGKFWAVLTESRTTRPSPGAGDPLDLCALGEDPGVCSQGPLARTLEPKTQPSAPSTLPSALGRLFSAFRSQVPPPPSVHPQEWLEVFPPT